MLICKTLRIGSGAGKTHTHTHIDRIDKNLKQKIILILFIVYYFSGVKTNFKCQAPERRRRERENKRDRDIYIVNINKEI